MKEQSAYTPYDREGNVAPREYDYFAEDAAWVARRDQPRYVHKLTKTDFEKLAFVLEQARLRGPAYFKNHMPSHEVSLTIDFIENLLVEYLRESNSSFDEDKFRRAAQG